MHVEEWDDPDVTVKQPRVTGNFLTFLETHSDLGSDKIADSRRQHTRPLGYQGSPPNE